MRGFLVWLMSAGFAFADGERAGDFDYYVLALSWSPTWCALEGDRRGSPQCEDDADFGWVLHGLWPQYEQGWPSYCNTSERNPSRSETGAMADIMGSGGSAWHQWNKHGRCSGLSSRDFYALAREAYRSVVRPDVFRRLERAVELPASVVEAAFLEDNPELSADGLTVTCKAGRIQETRICLTRDLEPRACTGSVARDCTMQDALFSPIR
ncbi:MAG: ribonuclease T2 [Boseongicola sp.]|nr:ribonuclease T2 [Boseongicola sp.]NNL17372.1 ribonuclease T2 [Boseongicola sp.]